MHNQHQQLINLAKVTAGLISDQKAASVCLFGENDVLLAATSSRLQRVADVPEIERQSDEGKPLPPEVLELFPKHQSTIPFREFEETVWDILRRQVVAPSSIPHEERKPGEIERSRFRKWIGEIHRDQRTLGDQLWSLLRARLAILLALDGLGLNDPSDASVYYLKEALAELEDALPTTTPTDSTLIQQHILTGAESADEDERLLSLCGLKPVATRTADTTQKAASSDPQPVLVGAAFWYLRDLVSLFRPGPRRTTAGTTDSDTVPQPGSPAYRVVRPAVSVKLPVLFAAEDVTGRKGEVGTLHLDLLNEPSNALTPDPYYQGLTVIGGGDAHGLGPSFHRVWTAWRSKGGGVGRGRWSVRRYDPATPFAAGSLDGRSLEAALMCLLLSAQKRLTSGSAEPTEFDSVLSSTMAITATVDGLESDQPINDLMELRLGKVSGLPEKLDAAADANGIDVVIVAASQLTEEELEDYRRRYSGRLEILTAATVGEAFQRLRAMSSVIRRFQRQKREEWDARWMTEEEARAQLDAIDGQPLESGVADSAAE